MAGKVVHITNETFEDQVLHSELPVVVDFWAPWCGPCRSIGPILDELADAYDGTVRVAKINVDEEPELARAFQVQGIPMLVAIRDEKIIHHAVGFGGRKPLEDLFTALAAPAEAPETQAS